MCKPPALVVPAGHSLGAFAASEEVAVFASEPVAAAPRALSPSFTPLSSISPGPSGARSLSLRTPPSSFCAPSPGHDIYIGETFLKSIILSLDIV